MALFEETQALQQLGRAEAIGPGHGTALRGGEAVAVQVDSVDVGATGGDTLVEDLRALVDQRQQATLEDFLVGEIAPRVAQRLGNPEHQGIHLGIVLRLAAARRVAVVTGTALLAEAAQLAKAVVHLHGRLVELYQANVRRIPDNLSVDERNRRGLQAYWKYLSSDLFTAYHELSVAGRTDPELQQILQASSEDFVAAWVKVMQLDRFDLEQRAGGLAASR